MQKDAIETKVDFRKSETTHDLLWSMYHNSGFTKEPGYGFGYKHEKSGLKAIMPRFFYKIWNGRWLDPGHTRQISVEDLQEFLKMKIDCRLNITIVLGRLMKGSDCKMWFMLPGLVEDWDGEMTDALLTVEWNVMDDINAHGLLQTDVESAVGEIRYWHEITDDRGISGTQYIVLPVKQFRTLKGVWIYEWRQLLVKASHLLDEFDAHKAEYAEKFATEVIPLMMEHKNYTWSQTEDDITIVRKNAFGDRFKQRFLHDRIGWQACLKEYDFLKELRG